MRAYATITVLFYVIAIAISLVAVYYIESVYNPPQPNISITYNAEAQAGIGYIINTLSFPIRITSIYCVLPSGEKLIFGSPNNNTLLSGSNTSIEIGVTNKSATFPASCPTWKVSYVQVSQSQAANQQSNSPFYVS